MIESKDKKVETEPTQTKEPRVPILTKGIGTRISVASKAIGGKRQLANALTISEGQLHRIISGDNQARIETIAEIAAATGFSLEWIAIGKGEQRSGDRTNEPAETYETGLRITPESLANALSAVEKVLKENKLKLSAKKRAKLALLAYEHMKIEQAEEIAKAHLRKLVDLASD